jgi:DNA-directed RNA polymerase II subunit RPB1
MSYITQRISEKKQLVAEIIEDADRDRSKALPSMTIRESFESKVELELNRAVVTTAIYLALLAMQRVTLRSLWGRT